MVKLSQVNNIWSKVSWRLDIWRFKHRVDKLIIKNQFLKSSRGHIHNYSFDIHPHKSRHNLDAYNWNCSQKRTPHEWLHKAKIFKGIKSPHMLLIWNRNRPNRAFLYRKMLILRSNLNPINILTFSSEPANSSLVFHDLKLLFSHEIWTHNHKFISWNLQLWINIL